MKAGKVIQRIIESVPMAFVMVLLVFLFVRAIPGDPVDIMMGSGGNVSEREIQAMRTDLGLDKPLGRQLVDFTKGLLHGDLGYSMAQKRNVVDLLLETFPATVELALTAIIFAVLLGLAIGVISAVRQNTLIDRISMGFSFLGISMPAFWLGLLAMFLFAMKWQLLPTSGRLTAGTAFHSITGLYIMDSIITGNWEVLKDALRHILLPAMTLGAELLAIVARVSRSSMVEVLRQDYIMLARAKGVSEKRAVLRHALPNALIPTVTVAGLHMGVLLGGNMIVETVFGWPGLGRLVVQSIFVRDYAVIQAAVALYALTFLAVNLLVDIAYTYLNPKISM
ncbi:MAG: ABC transporter permease [Desulfocucumaceae bacterium]